MKHDSPCGRVGQSVHRGCCLCQCACMQEHALPGALHSSQARALMLEQVPVLRHMRVKSWRRHFTHVHMRLTLPLLQARALMLEQASTDTWTVLDGEAVRPDPLYLEVHPGLLRVCVSPRFVEPQV